MTWFNNMPISRKLLCGFLFVGIFTIGLGIFAMDRLRTSHNEIVEFHSHLMPASQALGEIRAQMAEFRTYELAQISKFENREAFADYVRRMADARALAEKNYQILSSLVQSDMERTLLTNVSSNMDAYFSTHERIQRSLLRGDVVQAEKISDESSRPQRRELFDTLKQFNNYETAALNTQVAQSQAHYKTNMGLIIGVLGGILVVSVFLSTFIARLISRPVRQAVAAANAVAQGDFCVTLTTARTDEVGDLMRAMERMSGTIQDVIAAQNTMDEHHRNGRVSHRIDRSQYNGAFQTLVDATNSLVSNHIGVNVHMVDVLERYAQGDFSARMKNLPNEQAKITQAMDSARTNLLDINNDIKRLVAAAAAGDFTARGNATRYTNDFRVMVEGLNTLMENTEINLRDIAAVLHSVADGDLTVAMQGVRHGVFADMQNDTNRTVSQLSQIVSSIQETSQYISAAASEISLGNNDLSVRTEQQAASLEETAASMEELTSTVRHNADNSVTASRGACHAYDIAQQGQNAVAGVVAVMEQIENSAGQMRDIVSVIDRLAFQTNILSLNAAVEAARAGDSGKGFAVVAGEIRALAQSSAASAKDIRHLIDTSTTLIAQGAANAKTAGSTIDDVRNAVGHVREKMEEISHASCEQSSGIEQINTTIVAMDGVTQQNAAMVEEAAGTASALEDHAQILVRSVGVFKTHTHMMHKGVAVQKSRVTFAHTHAK